MCALLAAASLTVELPSAQALPPPLKVSIVGDSFSVGVGASNPLAGYAHLVGARGCWNLNLVARSGSGYAASPDPYVSVPRVAAVAVTIPDVIIVQGSGNDRGDSRMFAAAAGLYLTYRVVAPQARIIVVGPTGAPNAKQQNIENIRRNLRDAAAVAGATFIDPMAGGWLNASTDYAGDGIHPNTRGHARMSTRLFENLAGLKIPRLDSCGPR